MPKRGICKLCLNPGDLQESHMIPRALYKMAKEPGFDPVVMTRDVALHTSKQVQDYVFCWDCEQKFNDRGEKYVLGLVHKNGFFPLLNRLELVRVPTMLSKSVARYTTVGTEIDTRKMAYFALSVIWRSAVHEWKTIGLQKTTFELEDQQKESLRKFLYGCAGFPGNVYVLVSVCMDEVSQGHVLAPFTIVNEEEMRTHILLVRGICFRVMFDVPVRSRFQELCSVHSSGRFLFVDDCSKQTIEALRNLNENAKIAQNLRRKP